MAGFRLITLGRLALLAPQGEEDPSLAARRLKLVLLAVLASAKRPLSRDTLLTLFWPEQEEERARHSLSDALSHLRRVLGSTAISTRQAEVSLSPAAGLVVDAIEFARMVESKDVRLLGDAIGLYGGPFLDGVHVSGSQELEEWIARERARMEALFVRAAEPVCSMLAREGRWDESGALAARWLDAVPLSTEAALYRLKALRAPGTPDAAQRALADYRRLTAKLREDYGRGPGPALAAFARELESQLGPAEAEAPASPAPERVARAPMPEAAVSGMETAVAGAREGEIGRRPRHRPLALAALGLVSILAATVMVTRVHRPTRVRAAPAAARPGPPAGATDRILLADFRNDTRDSLLSDAVTEALRVDLEQSPVVEVLGSGQIADVLRRMERPAAGVVTDTLAREVALRGGAKAFITGDVGELGTAVTLSAQLVATESGGVLAAFRETARDSTRVIDAVDRLSQRLRGRLGEALGQVQANPPLEQVTTSSLAALRDYSEAIRAGERQGDASKAIALLQEAVSLDPEFAMAYRKLGAELELLGYSRQEQALEAEAKAFRFRDRLTDRERYLTMASYYMDTDQPDKAAAAYRAVLDRYPQDVRALNNLGSISMQLRDYRRAEALRRRAIAADSTLPVLYNNLAQALFCEGKYDQTDSVLREARRRFPSYAPAVWTEISLAAARGDFAAAERDARAALTQAGTDYDRKAEALRLLAELALVRGRLSDAEQRGGELLELIRHEGEASDFLDASGFLAFIETWYRRAPTRAVARLDAAIASHPLARIPLLERHADWLAYNYALADKPDRARALLAEFQAAHPTLGIGDRGQYLRAAGAVELALRRYPDAIATLQEAHAQYWCPICTLPDLGRAYDLAGNRDSAIAVYSRYVTTPWVWWLASDGEFHAWVYRRLGQLYEAAGDSSHASEAYQKAVTLWKDADPELQPAVAEARNRLAILGGRDGERR